MGAAISELVQHWKTYDPALPWPKLHVEDAKHIDRRFLNEIDECSVDAYLKERNLGGIHAALQPVPYLGNLEKADLFLFMINPSVELTDYGTQAKEQFLDALRQQREQTETHFLPCVSSLWWTSWFSYYSRLLSPTLRRLMKIQGKTMEEVLTDVSERIAILELVPYFSENAAAIERLPQGLPSIKLARSAAREICQRAKDGSATVVVRWSDPARPDRWDLGPLRNYVVQSPVRGGLSNNASLAIFYSLLPDCTLR